MKTKIEWCDYSLNPVKGFCPMGCSYCYARRMYWRFGWDSELRLDKDCFLPLLNTSKRKPSRVFVGSTMELFGDWIQSAWMDFIFQRVEMLPEHTFIFLTKQPQNVAKWSPFPDNCWVGVSVTDERQFQDASRYLREVKARVRFYSFEPLLSMVSYAQPMFFKGNWVIIGQQTPIRKNTMPPIDWIREIVEAADQMKVPVFLKNNLWHLLNDDPLGEARGISLPWARGRNGQDADILRQEFPAVLT